MALLTCPTCGKAFDSAETEAMPFCSNRCRQIDLGRWLDEKHSLPHVPSPDDDEVPEGDAPQNGRDH